MVLSTAVAMPMFALYIGRVQIAPEYYRLFQESMKTCLHYSRRSLLGWHICLARQGEDALVSAVSEV
jgi:hypothetical protein